jgi:AcrR family transcriptional regulator
MTTRRYSMTVRARSAEATRRRVLEAATDLLRVRLRTNVRLADVAADAGVSEMTVLRLFGTKAELLQAALENVQREMVAQRQEPEPGDVEGSLTALFDHYEQFGDLVLGNLAIERSDPTVTEMLAMGRTDHRDWVRRQFGPQLAARPENQRRLLTDALVVACDVYAWKRLRRDMRRSRRHSMEIVKRIVDGLIDADPAEPV